MKPELQNTKEAAQGGKNVLTQSLGKLYRQKDSQFTLLKSDLYKKNVGYT